jgi:polar amino acid transport system substrate-binding protein
VKFEFRCGLTFLMLTGLSLLLNPEQVQAAPLADIVRRGTLIVGVKDNLPPLGYRDAAGTLQGYEIDLARRLAKTLFESESELILKPLSNVERLTAVTSGTVDLVIADLTLTEARLRVVNFSHPYYRSGTGLLSRNARWTSLQSLFRQTIAVLMPSVTLANLKPRLPQATLVSVNSYAEAKAQLDASRVQAVAGDQIVLSSWARQDPQYAFRPTKLTVQPLAVAFPKGVQYVPLQQWVDGHLQEWQQQGWLEAQRQRWALP